MKISQILKKKHCFKIKFKDKNQKSNQDMVIIIFILVKNYCFK